MLYCFKTNSGNFLGGGVGWGRVGVFWFVSDAELYFVNLKVVEAFANSFEYEILEV